MPVEITELISPSAPGADGWAPFVACMDLRNHAEREQLGSGDQAWSSDQLLAYLRAQQYHHKIIWVATNAGSVVGFAQYERAHDTADPTASFEVAVAPGCRRLGIGTRLLATVVAQCRRSRATRLRIGSVHGDLTSRPRLAAPTGVGDVPAGDPSSTFLTAAGFALGQVEVISELPLPLPGRLLDDLEARLRPAPAFDLVSWLDDTPDEMIEPYARLRTVMSTAAPTGELTEVEQVWDAARVRDRDVRDRDMRLTGLTTAAREIATGELVGFTTLIYDDQPGHAISQGYTLVLPGHRGHNLGMRIKINNLRLLAGHPHTARRVVTGNAGENEAMLAINRALGYRPVWSVGWWELDLTRTART